MRYTKYPKNIRFDKETLKEASQYQKLHNVDFSTLVRVAVGSFLRRKLYDIDDTWG
jgi:hypothetical protein